MAFNSRREYWGSKLGFVLAAAGSAVGLGNIWKFPYVTGSNGGAAFVLIYVIFVLILGLPIMIAEFVIGRHTEKDPVGAFKLMAGRSPWTIVGYMGVLSGFLILSFYSIVGGWTIGYIIKSISGSVTSLQDSSSAKSLFAAFTADPVQMILYHALFMLSCMFIVVYGIKNGIERWNKILMPLLFGILFVLIGRSLMMEGAWHGLSFFLKPDFSKINAEFLIAAMGQAFFSLSLGMGAMITYGSYLSPNEKILTSAFYIVVLDTLVAILAGLAIFPAVFAMNMSPQEGVGLIFHIIPVIFSNMPYGAFFSVLFFTLLFIAALTSGVSLLEVITAYVIDEMGWARRRAVVVFGTVIFILGIPSALSFGASDAMKLWGNLTFFDLIDKLTTNYMLPLGGFLIAVYLGWKYGLEKTIHELDPDTRIISLKELWAFFIKFISPVLVFILFLMLLRNDIIGQ